MSRHCDIFLSVRLFWAKGNWDFIKVFFKFHEDMIARGTSESQCFTMIGESIQLAADSVYDGATCVNCVQPCISGAIFFVHLVSEQTGFQYWIFWCKIVLNGFRRRVCTFFFVRLALALELRNHLVLHVSVRWELLMGICVIMSKQTDGGYKFYLFFTKLVKQNNCLFMKSSIFSHKKKKFSWLLYIPTKLC